LSALTVKSEEKNKILRRLQTDARPERRRWKQNWIEMVSCVSFNIHR